MSKPLAVKWGRGAFELIPSSIDEDDQRILGFEIFQSGIFLGRKISKVFFGVPSFGQGFLGIRNNLKIVVIVPHAFAVRVVPAR